ncbi:MAG: AAA family ATPase [Thermoanaerobaculia bacterium]
MDKKREQGLLANADQANAENRWISEVQIQRFKAAFKPDPIQLSRFNVVIGRNGSGKSTLLEALQWLDATIRRDAREACDRYYGIRDLINLRSQSEKPYFELSLTWSSKTADNLPLRYEVRVEDRDGTPVIAREELAAVRKGPRLKRYIYPRGDERVIVSGQANGNGLELAIREPDRLALGLLSSTQFARLDPALGFLEGFWSRAVFLRLSPNRLALGSLATRKSFEPLLDEEGQSLPALLNELTAEQREDLVEAVREILPGIRDVEVSRSESGRDTRVNYNLVERMPYRGRSGRSQFPIPAWMLSEGTRRITAILALLAREPAPSLLCIEEIENGLDPWTIRTILRHLQSAADRGTQVILTTHSPWVLDFVPMNSILQVRRIEGDTRYEHFASRPAIAAFNPSVPAGTRYTQSSEDEE